MNEYRVTVLMEAERTLTIKATNEERARRDAEYIVSSWKGVKAVEAQEVVEL